MENTTTPIRKKRRQKTGTVVSQAMDKTIVVEVLRIISHPRYKKYIKRTKKYMVHDEKNAASVGDRVIIMETRPLSKRKSFRLVKIIEKSK